jgi:hypothetical protein
MRPKKHSLILAALALTALGLGAIAALAGGHQLVPGTKVRLVPPEGFTAATTFVGFQKLDIACSILVRQMPAPYAQMARGMTAENLASRGVKLISKETVQLPGGEGTLMKGSQSNQGVDYMKWFLLFGDPSHTVIIVATCPNVSWPSMSAPLEKSLLTATEGPAPKVDPFEHLPFKISPVAPLRFAKKLDRSVIYCESGGIPTATPDEAVLVVAPSEGTARVGNRRSYTLKRLRATTTVKSIRTVSVVEVTIGGLSGFEVVAKAKDKKTNAPTVIYHVMLYDEDQTYFIIQGMVGPAKSETALETFRKSARTFEKK